MPHNFETIPSIKKLIEAAKAIEAVSAISLISTCYSQLNLMVYIIHSIIKVGGAGCQKLQL